MIDINTKSAKNLCSHLDRIELTRCCWIPVNHEDRTQTYQLRLPSINPKETTLDLDDVER